MFMQLINSIKARTKPGQEKGSSGKIKGSFSKIYMLVTASVCFIVFTLPESVVQLWQASAGEKVDMLLVINTYDYETMMFLFFNIIVFYWRCINNSINFLIYCVSGTQFRSRAFIAMMTCGKTSVDR